MSGVLPDPVVVSSTTSVSLSHTDNVYLMRVEGFAYLALIASLSLTFLFSTRNQWKYKLQIRMPITNSITELKSYVTRADGLIAIIFMYIISVQTARYSFTHLQEDFVRICDLANLCVLIFFLRSFLSRTVKHGDNVVLFIRALGLAAISASLYFNDLKEDGSLHGPIAKATATALYVCSAIGIVVVGITTFLHIRYLNQPPASNATNSGQRSVQPDAQSNENVKEEVKSGPDAPYLMISVFDIGLITFMVLLIYSMVLAGNLSGNNLWYTIAFFIPPSTSFIVWCISSVQCVRAFFDEKKTTVPLYNWWMQTCLTFALFVLAFVFYQQRGYEKMELESRFAMNFQVGTFTITALFWLIPIVWYDDMIVLYQLDEPIGAKAV